MSVCNKQNFLAKILLINQFLKICVVNIAVWGYFILLIMLNYFLSLFFNSLFYGIFARKD